MNTSFRRPSRASFDALLAAVLAVFALVLGFAVPGGRALDLPAVALLLAGSGVLVWRRERPGLVLLLVMVLTVPYHMLDYRHEAASPMALVALATFAARVDRAKALVIGIGVGITALGVMSYLREGVVNEDHLGAVGWILFAAVAGQAWRFHHAYVASILDRAERAEHTREEEARRRVAEERVRIARDLHDLLAHSITLIGVQAGVAAHLARGPRPDGAVRAEALADALADALDSIADSCRVARAEVRATLTVLRDASEAPELGAVPGLNGLPDLVETVRGTGVAVTLDVPPGLRTSPEVGVAAYRIVQEALTNVVRHAGAAHVDVVVGLRNGALVLDVTDDGGGATGRPAKTGEPADGPGGFGILGMAERARSVGGTLSAEPTGGGFAVRAVLPLGGEPTAVEPVPAVRPLAAASAASRPDAPGRAGPSSATEPAAAGPSGAASLAADPAASGPSAVAPSAAAPQSRTPPAVPPAARRPLPEAP